MPSVSAAQHRLFGWAKSHPAEAAKRGIKPGIAQEFLAADKGRSFGPAPQKPKKSTGNRLLDLASQ